jgi:hypothetical protein
MTPVEAVVAVLTSPFGCVAGFGLSLAAMTSASLKYARDLARDRRDQLVKLIEIEEAERIRGDSKVVIEPFQHITWNESICPKCGTKSEKKSSEDRGITKMPSPCNDPVRCVAAGEPHLHVNCASCRSHFYMRPKSYVDEKEEHP